MGHYTAFNDDIQKGVSQSRLLAKAFNRLSCQKYESRVIANLGQKCNSSEITIRDIETGKSILVDPRPRGLMNHGGHMIYCRNAKMTKQERINWAIDRVIWLAVMENGIPESYSIIPVKELMKKGQIDFNSPQSNPTALKFSAKGYMPTIPWQGGSEGFGFVKYKDVVKEFIGIING